MTSIQCSFSPMVSRAPSRAAITHGESQHNHWKNAWQTPVARLHEAGDQQLQGSPDTAMMFHTPLDAILSPFPNGCNPPPPPSPPIRFLPGSACAEALSSNKPFLVDDATIFTTTNKQPYHYYCYDYYYCKGEHSKDTDFPGHSAVKPPCPKIPSLDCEEEDNENKSLDPTSCFPPSLRIKPSLAKKILWGSSSSSLSFRNEQDRITMSAEAVKSGHFCFVVAFTAPSRVRV